MGLFDIFTFKKDGKKIFSKEVFKEVLEEARDRIVEQAKAAISGEEKKDIVDKFVIAFVQAKVKSLEIKNGLVLWIVNRVIGLIPLVTQIVYNFLKEKVEAL